MLRLQIKYNKNKNLSNDFSVFNQKKQSNDFFLHKDAYFCEN